MTTYFHSFETHIYVSSYVKTSRIIYFNWVDFYYCIINYHNYSDYYIMEMFIFIQLVVFGMNAYN